MAGIKDQKDPHEKIHHGGWMAKILCWVVIVFLTRRLSQRPSIPLNQVVEVEVNGLRQKSSADKEMQVVGEHWLRRNVHPHVFQHRTSSPVNSD
uniref:Uncharacterized protein n=1 Tax=Oryza punctata TaxID=4537 RepID=A0A0E0K118_ORYPU